MIRACLSMVAALVIAAVLIAMHRAWWIVIGICAAWIVVAVLAAIDEGKRGATRG